MIINEVVSSFDPESVLPDQFFESVRLPAAVAAERKLMLAILQDAIECYQHNLLARSPKGRHDFEEARQWILSHEDEWVFSYENICSTLGIDAAYVRDALLAMSRRCRRGPVRKHPTPRIVPLCSRTDDETLKIAS